MLRLALGQSVTRGELGGGLLGLGNSGSAGRQPGLMASRAGVWRMPGMGGRDLLSVHSDALLDEVGRLWIRVGASLSPSASSASRTFARYPRKRERTILTSRHTHTQRTSSAIDGQVTGSRHIRRGHLHRRRGFWRG